MEPDTHDRPPAETVNEIEDLVMQNQALLAENNKLLKKIHRSNTWAFWLRILWLGVFLGLPFLLYYYIVAPYYQSLDSAFQFFGVELPDIPSWGASPAE